jgi:hypothetical protein
MVSWLQPLASMLRAIAVSLLALLAACEEPSSGVDGGSGHPDAAPGQDGGGDDTPDAGTGGLTIHFTAGLPNVAPAVTLDEARIWLRDVRAIGDSAPGDSRTSLDEAELDARSDREPAPIAFALAPPGIYSRLDMRLGQTDGDGSQGYELRGHVTIDSSTFELEVTDRGATDAISVALGGLVVDNASDVTIAIDLSFLGGIDWASAPRDGQKITLDEGAALTLEVRAGIVSAFAVVP